jgi:hypothetical protein
MAEPIKYQFISASYKYQQGELDANDPAANDGDD